MASCYVQIPVDYVFRILELPVGWHRRKEAGWLIHTSVEQEYYFPAIKNPLDEAMRTCFICAIAINNEAVLKSVFREPEEKLTFSKAVHCNRSKRSSQNSKGPSVFKTRGSPQLRSKRRSSTITIRSHHHLPNNRPVHRHSVIVVERKAMR